jgi:molybdopterin-synthase adenylyltransferase
MPDIAGRLHLMPVQIIAVEDGAVLRRGTVRLHVAGEAAVEAVHRIAAVAATGATAEEIAGAFDEPAREAVGRLLDELRARRFLVAVDDAAPADESRLDVFYWNFGASRRAVDRAIAARPIAIVGVNAVSRAAAEGLAELGFRSVAVVDHPLLRNVDCIDEAGRVDAARWPGPAPVPYDAWSDAAVLPDCLVVASDFGGLSLMREWNAFCVEAALPFLPLVLQDFVGYVGPLVVPDETACFECFWLRQNSNMQRPDATRLADGAAFQGQLVDGLAPTMAGFVGRAGAFELFRFFGGALPPWRPDRVIEIDLVQSTMTPRRFLRVPRCPVCTPGLRHGRVALDADADMPGHPYGAS